jgi:hypothetical protein
MQRYIGGEEVNNLPDIRPVRWVINFGTRDLEDCSTWPDLLELIRARVKPERDENPRSTYQKYWWRLGETGGAMYKALMGLEECLVCCQVSRNLQIARQSSFTLFPHTLCVFALSAHSSFAVLQSRVHEPWARLLSSSMKTDLRYVPSDCFSTFPFPQPDPRAVIPALEDIGERLYTARAAYMVETQQGLTQTYNALKDPRVNDPRVVALRRLHEEMDRAVLAAYGWDDLEVPVYGGATTEGEKQALSRFEDAVIDRLFALNATRAAEERAAAAQQAATAGAAKAKGGGGRKKKGDAGSGGAGSGQGTLGIGFRSIKSASIRLDRYSLIAGANNCGKSNVIDAICTAFGVRKWDTGRDAPRSSGSAEPPESWVECEFQASSDDELEGIENKNKLPNRRFRVRSIQDEKHLLRHKAEEYGSGFQRNLIFSLLKLRAKYQADNAGSRSTKKTKGKAGKAEFAPNFSLILFEEPEVFLHPDQIDTLRQSLRSLAQVEGTQVLLTTHNSTFLSHNISEITSYIRMSTVGGFARSHQVSSEKLAEIFDANSAALQKWKNDPDFSKSGKGKIHPDDYLVEMEAIKHSLWLNPLRSAMFFARKVLLVEGPTETAVISWMGDNEYLGDWMRGVFVMDSMGKYNMHRFVAILDALGIEHAALLDTDKRLAVVDGTIRDSAGVYTLGMDWFESDIEAFLGVKSTDAHRKPQHMLHSLQSGAVDEDRIKLLANKIRTLVSGRADVQEASLSPPPVGAKTGDLVRFPKRFALLSLSVAAGGFSASQTPRAEGMVSVHAEHEASSDSFVAVVKGKSMEPTVPEGSYCLFRFFQDPSSVSASELNGRRVLVQLHEDSDPEHGGRYTLKQWVSHCDESGAVLSVDLVPDNVGYETKSYRGEQCAVLRAVAELVEVVEIDSEGADLLIEREE